MLSPFIKVGANYNVLAIAFYIFGIYMYSRKNSIKNIFLQGIVMFLVFFTKQNIGIYYILAIVILNMLSKDSFLVKLKLTLKEISVFLVLILISSLVMILKGNFISFVNYAFYILSIFFL